MRGGGAVTRRAQEHRRKDMPERSGPEWQEFGGSLRDLQIIHGLGGCLEAFARDEAGALIRRYQSEPDGEWGPWDVFAEDVEAYSVVSDGRGRVAVLTLEGDGWIRLCAVDDDGAWSEWTDVHEAPAARIAAVYRKRGLVLMVATDDRLEILEQQRKGGWDEPYELAGGFNVLALARNGADHLHLFGLDCDGRLSTTVQREARGLWDDWSVLGGGFRGMHPFLGEDGRLHLVAVGAVEGVGWTLETEPGAGWEEWAATPLTYVDAFALARAGRGIESYAIDGAGDGWREIWSDAGQGTREPLGRRRLVALRAIETESGNVELFAVDEHGAAWRCVVP